MFPRIWPLAVRPLSPPTFLASPKSVTLGCPALVEKHVGRLQVAMNDAARMGIGDGLGRCPSQLGGFAWRQRSVADAIRQAGPVDVAHRKKVLPMSLANFVDRHDAGVVEIGRRLGLQAKPFDVLFAGQHAREDHLERDDSVEIGLPCPKYDPHAAAGNFIQQLVVAEGSRQAVVSWQVSARPGARLACKFARRQRRFVVVDDGDGRRRARPIGRLVGSAAGRQGDVVCCCR